MVQVGILGLGPLWDAEYREALERLGGRIAVRAVFDEVAGRSDPVARRLGATVVDGIISLTSRPDVKGVLFLDSGWSSPQALRLAIRSGKPVFIAPSVAPSLNADADELLTLHRTAGESGQTLMPAMWQRFLPACTRLRELIATRLGPPLEITIDATVGKLPAVAGQVSNSSEPPSRRTADGLESRPTGDLSGEELMIGLFDWCRMLLRARPEEVAAVPLDECGEAFDVRIQYRSVKSRPAAQARIRFEGTHRVRYTVDCENGSAVITGPTSIEWSADGATMSESLLHERPAVDVMLDHFCRRVVGGLIPVADLQDISRSLILLAATRNSLESGGPVSMNGKS